GASLVENRNSDSPGPRGAGAVLPCQKSRTPASVGSRSPAAPRGGRTRPTVDRRTRSRLVERASARGAGDTNPASRIVHPFDWQRKMRAPALVEFSMPGRFLTTGCVAAAALAVAHAQQQPPTFGTTTRTVAVYATVTDPQGRLAPDLTRDNFEVDDNGVKQELTVFSNDVQPITGIMLLDRSGSMKPNFELEVRAAETFIHGMLAEDRLRIGSFGKDIVIEPDDFTSDRDALFKVLHGDLQREGPTPLWNAIDRAIDKLLLVKSRRVVLALSDGVDEPIDFSGHAKSMKDEMKRAEDNDIMIYAVGMEGLAPMAQQRATQGFGGRGIMRSE